MTEACCLPDARSPAAQRSSSLQNEEALLDRYGTKPGRRMYASVSRPARLRALVN